MLQYFHSLRTLGNTVCDCDVESTFTLNRLCIYCDAAPGKIWTKVLYEQTSDDCWWKFLSEDIFTLSVNVCMSVSSGGSRIFQTGAPTLQVGTPTYYLAKCFPKLHENERNWILRGARVPGAPQDPPVVSTDARVDHNLSKFQESLQHPMAQLEIMLSYISLKLSFLEMLWKWQFRRRQWVFTALE